MIAGLGVRTLFGKEVRRFMRVYGQASPPIGYVQFCLFDDNYPNAPLSDMELRRVHD